MVFFRLAREARNERRPQADVRNLFPKPSDDAFQLFPSRAASHFCKDLIRRVLDRHIQIMTDLRLLLHDLNQFLCDLLRIAVQKPDPYKPVDRTELPKKLRQHLFAV